MFDLKSGRAQDFIDHQEILCTLETAKKDAQDQKIIGAILEKARKHQGLDYQEATTLLLNEDDTVTEKLYEIARDIKDEIYGKRIVMFAPLYLSNYCVNECRYCPYHYGNDGIARKKLTQEEIAREVVALQDMGHKRLALETGEDPLQTPIEYVLDSIKTIYSVKHQNGQIRRVNVNIAATTVENYQKLKEAGIGTYILFQETYHKETYEYMHPKGPKSNYAYHTEAMDRAMQGGIDDVGIGVLFGLYDYHYDFVGLLLHARHLEERFGVGPHTISVPRIRPADDVDVNEFPNAVFDSVFKKLVALIRVTVPYTGIIISTRESKSMRKEALEIGVSQISGASSTNVGGYCEDDAKNTAQFEVSDERSLDEIVGWLGGLGYIPSFCTACYREGRTGDRFMRLAKTGQIGNVCQANALMTLKEYLCDYASNKTKQIGEQLIAKEMQHIPNKTVYARAAQNLCQIEQGNRDFRF